MTISLDDKNENDLVIGINKLGVGVAMNNTVNAIPATPSNAAVNPANTNINNIQLDDVQKLQQQLQDIKEQVRISYILHFRASSFRTDSTIYILLPHGFFFFFFLFRRCVQCALIVSKIWYFCVAMERVKCAAIKLMDAPFVERPLKNEFYSSKLGQRIKIFNNNVYNIYNNLQLVFFFVLLSM